MDTTTKEVVFVIKTNPIGKTRSYFSVFVSLLFTPALTALLALGGIFVSVGLFSNSAYAASDISVSSSGKVSFGKVLASSAGSMVTGEDTLNISTDCEAGANVYATGTDGGSTSLVNKAAESLDSGGTNASTYTISTSAFAIGSASALSNNTWGLNTNATEASNGLYYGLPAYSSSSLPTTIYSGTNSTVPIYYGAKVTNSLTPGTYSGEVLYTVTVNNSCLDYTVKFDKNAPSATGEMSDQAILPTGGTLRENGFTYDGYNFLGWSLSATGKTGNAVDGIGTSEDVDFPDKASFPGSNESILPGSETTLYAIWEVKPPEYMQDWIGCSKLAEGESTTLIDKRDNAEYTVKKFGTGSSAECWMTSNLTLGYDQTNNVTKGYTLTKDDTNIPDNTTYYLPPAGKRGSVTSSSTVTATNAAVFNDSTAVSEAQVQYRAAGQAGDTSSTGTLFQNTGYYNYPAATLGYSYYNDGLSSGNSPRDICPAGWQLPRGSSTSTHSFYWLDTTLGGTGSNRTDTTTRDKFLNDASFGYSGFYYSSQLYSVGLYGSWWSSTLGSSAYAYYMNLGSDGSVYPQYSDGKYGGFSIRCIAKYSNVSGYMQDFDSNTELPNETDATYLMDKRDSKVYTVKRLPDGKVWMMQNLTINGTELTPADTNITDGNTYYLPKNGGRGRITDPNTKNSTSGYNFNTDYKDQASFIFRSKGSYTNDSDTGYYNFYTATLGYSYYGDGKTSGTSPQDICPKGWRMPRTTDAGTTVSTIDASNDFTYLASRYGSINNGTATSSGYYSTDSAVMNSMYKNAASPLATSTNNNLAGFSYSGMRNGTGSENIGSYGYYWSASISDTNSGYFMFIRSSWVWPQNGGTSGLKIYGLAVRCVAKQPYTINYNANGGTGEMSPSKGYIGGSTLSRNTFTKDGYYFLGWSTDPSATSPTYTDGATISTNLTSAGGSVTLYAVWGTENPSIMQTSNVCQYIPEGQTVNLTDSRDGQPYPVYHIPSNAVYPGTSTVANVAGKCFMAKDLNLGAVASVAGSDSTIVANGDMTLSPLDSNFTTPTGTDYEGITIPTTNVTVSYKQGSWDSSNSNYNNKQYTTNGTGSYAGRGYYSWGAAMTVCPKGWRLPAQDEYNNNDSSYNASTAGISKLVNNTLSTAQASPWSLNLGGYYYGSFGDATSLGYYWSSTQYSNSINSYFLYLNSSYGLIRDASYKYLGFAVRCIAD